MNFYHIIAKMEINSVISAIAKIAPATATLAINPAQRSETVIRIKQQLGLDPIQPPNDTISVYIYALIEYGVYKPEPLLKLFREKEIQKAFWKDFNADHPLIFTPEIEHFLDWNTLGDEIRELENINIRQEFEEFYQVFVSVARRTRTPAEALRDQESSQRYDYPQEFQSLITEKIKSFCGRKFVFAAFKNFINTNKKGYFTVIGDAGMGKSTITAKYVFEHKTICYFNNLQENRNSPELFLESIRQQLINRYQLTNVDKDDLSTLLVKATEKLTTNEKLIIVVDALDEVNQEPGAENILHLPKTLPDNVYFFLTRRSYEPTKERLYIEGLKKESLDLTDSQYDQENQHDIQEYIRFCLNDDPELKDGLQTWIKNKNITPDAFVNELATKSENNFMYLRYVLPAIAEGKYNDLNLTQLPQGLQDYYVEHWKRMKMNDEAQIYLRKPYHFVNSGKPENLTKYFQTLTDYQFITAKINHPEFGIQALIEDYDLLDATQTATHPDQSKTLKYIQSALLLSAHIVTQDQQQLPSQLWGRLQTINTPEIQTLLTQAQQTHPHPWLRPLTRSLTQAGGRLLRNLTGHSNFVRAVAVTVDGTRVISGSSDNTVKVWNLETGEEQFTLTGHSDWVRAVAVTADGTRVISGSDDNTVKVWNLETGEEQFTLTGHSGFVLAVAVDGKRVISGSSDNTVKVWNLETGEEQFTLTGHSGFVQAVAVTADGTRVISGSDDNTVKVWNLETGEELFTLTGHSDWVRAVAVTADGTRVISGSDDNTVKVWNLETGEEQFTLTGHSGFVLAVAVDGKRVISGSDDNTVKVWNLETGKEQFTLTGHSGVVQAVSVTADRTRVISGSWDKTVKVWNLETGEELFTLTGHSDWVRAVAVTADGTRVISGSDDKTVKVWNLETGEELFTLTGHSDWVRAVAVTADGTRVISGSEDNTVKVWNLETGEEQFTLLGHSDWVRAVSVTADGTRVISGSDDNTVKVWNLETGEEQFTLLGHSSFVRAVSVTADGTRVISGSWDNTVKVWNLETGEEIATFIGDSSFSSCAVAPNGLTIIAGDPSGRVHFLKLENPGA